MRSSSASLSCVISTNFLVEATGCVDSKTMAARSVFQSTNTPSSIFFRKTRIYLRNGGTNSDPSGNAFRRAGYTRSAILRSLATTPNTVTDLSPEKRDMKGGFRESPLKLNEGLSGLDKWDEAAIKNRAERLAAVATGVWAVPSLQAEVLELYRPRGEKAARLHDR